MKNPFNYLQFSTGDQFYDCKGILAFATRWGQSSIVNSAKKKLLEDGILETDDGRRHVADSLFAVYLRVL